MVSSDTYVFYNTETGEFGHYTKGMDPEYDDRERFEGDDWMAAPDHYEINEYGMMVDFVDGATDPRRSELLSIALNGKGAFRRFRDVLHRTGLTREWDVFRRNAYVDAVREWCRYNEIPYEDVPPGSALNDPE
jgi:hypothetical protein